MTSVTQEEDYRELHYKVMLTTGSYTPYLISKLAQATLKQVHHLKAKIAEASEQQGLTVNDMQKGATADHGARQHIFWKQ